MRASRLVALFVLASAVLSARAATARPSIEAELSPNTVAPGDEAVYTLTITDAAGGRVSMPRFGDLVAQGPSTSMQSAITISNGQQTIQTSKVYSWNVQAPRQGQFVIGPATLQHNGETFQSNAVTLSADPNAPRAQPQARSNPFGGNAFDPFGALDDFPDPFGGQQQQQRQPGGDQVFLRAFVDKSQAYLGEQVTMSLYLYAQTDVAGVQSVSFPRLDGFWAEDIAAPTQLTPEIRNLHGTPYRAYLLRRRALFPLRSGDLTIDPVEAQVNLGVAMFWGAPQDTVKRRSSAITVTVKPLPAEGQPPGLVASNVGELSLSAQASPRQLSLGTPVQLKVTLEGTGNLKSVQVPRPALPAGLKTYDPTITDKPRIAGGRYGGTKTIEWVVIPERTGSFSIPPIELPYFSPSKGAYEVARTQPIALTVTAPAGQAATTSSGAVSLPPVANVLTDSVRPVRLQVVLATSLHTPLWQRRWFWPATGAPVALWALLWVGGALGGALRRRDPEKLKVRRARGQAGRRLKLARELVAKNDARELQAELVRVLLQFVTDKTGVPALGLTREELARHLAARGVPEVERSALVQLLERCETARFAPANATKEELGRTLDEASRLIDAIDGLKLSARSA